MKSISKLFVCCALPLAADILAATGSGASGIEGTVSLAGAALPGTEVVVSSAASGQLWEASTDNLGRYVLDGVPPGRYTVWAEAIGRGCIVFGDVLVKAGVRVHRDFRFTKNKTYPGCESMTRKRPR